MDQSRLNGPIKIENVCCVSIKELNNSFGSDYSVDTMEYQSQILDNSWKKNCMKI